MIAIQYEYVFIYLFKGKRETWKVKAVRCEWLHENKKGLAWVGRVHTTFEQVRDNGSFKIPIDGQNQGQNCGFNKVLAS